MPVSRDEFELQCRPLFGTANPERMRCAFWEWMIRGDDGPPEDGEEDTGLLGQCGLVMRNGVLKSGYGPYRARDHFQVPLNRNHGPIWTFDRMGATQTALPDGRVVFVGGEHEDYYDPDFCIYNDVVVFGPGDVIEIYGYPKEVFPPTDSHTATLIGDEVFIVGCLGYPDDRRPGHTPVHLLNTSGYRITDVRTSGEAPGWVWNHEAVAGPDGVITLRGGELLEERNGERRFRRNVEEFALDTRTGVWRRLTDRNWPQYDVYQADHKWFVLEHRPEREQLYPQTVEHNAEPCDDWNRIRFKVRGIPVSVTIELRTIEILVEGRLPDALADRIAEGVRAGAETATKRPCLVARVS